MVDEDLLQQYCMLVALTTCLIKFLLDWFSAAFSLPKQIEKSKIQGELICSSRNCVFKGGNYEHQFQIIANVSNFYCIIVMLSIKEHIILITSCVRSICGILI